MQILGLDIAWMILICALGGAEMIGIYHINVLGKAISVNVLLLDTLLQFRSGLVYFFPHLSILLSSSILKITLCVFFGFIILSLPISDSLISLIMLLLVITHSPYILLSTPQPAPPEPPLPQTAKDRKRRMTSDEGDKILDKLNEGYFLCRRISLNSIEEIILIFHNKKAQEILSQFGAPFHSLIQQFVDSEKPEKTLKMNLVEAFSEGFEVGQAIKSFYGYSPFQSSNNSTSSNKQLCEIQQIPFKYFKIFLSRTNSTDVLLIFKESDPKKPLDYLEGLRTGISCTLSHELKTLTNGIIGNIELFGGEVNLTRSQKLFYRLSHCSSFLLASKLNDLFDYIQLHNKAFKLHYSEFLLSEIYEKAFNICKTISRQKQISLEIEKSKDLPDKVLGDKGRIQQILMNLLSKAIEFTDYGKIKLNISYKKYSKIITFKVISYGENIQMNMEEKKTTSC